MLLFFLLLIILVVLFIRLKDRHPGYELNINHTSPSQEEIKVGFSAKAITPKLIDTWNDANNNAIFDENEEWQDVNENGKFDAVWIAGFHNNRPASGIHDDLWARTMVMTIGDFTYSWTVLDLIGYGNDQVISIRKEIQKELPIDYSIVASTHTHEGPDVLGMWGSDHFKSGIDKDYLNYINSQVVESVKDAFTNRKSASVSFGIDKTGAAHLVEDSRPPFIIEPVLQTIEFKELEQNSTLGTIVYWSNHPETTWDKNLLITSDFAHYLREGVEHGVTTNSDSIAKKGVGGICMFANGMIGGLMTTSPSLAIKDPFTDIMYTKPSFAKAKAQGETLAMLALDAMENTTDSFQKSSLRLKAKSFDLPLDNSLYRLASAVGIFDRGLTGWWKMRTEVAYLSFADAEFLFHPSEIYPEIVMGGIENPEGGDLGKEIMETPPLNDFLTKRFRFFPGLSNDLIGYVIPTSQWDKEPPFTYESDEAHYGEINSCGPKTAEILYEELKSLLE